MSSNWLLALEFFGFAGITLVIAFWQLYKLKKMEREDMRRRRERAMSAAPNMHVTSSHG